MADFVKIKLVAVVIAAGLLLLSCFFWSRGGAPGQAERFRSPRFETNSGSETQLVASPPTMLENGGSDSGKSKVDDEWGFLNEDRFIEGFSFELGEKQFVTEKLIEALDLTENEVKKINASMASAFLAVRSLEVQHMRLFTEEADESVLLIDAFPEEGKASKDIFEADLSELLGPERLGRFNEIGRSFFAIFFGDFGERERVFRITRQQYTHPKYELPETFDVKLYAIKNEHEAPVWRELDLTDPDFFEKKTLVEYSAGKRFAVSEKVGVPWMHFLVRNPSL
ncbi:MAG: hypothetical protein AAF514_16460 [Verrucomicrobiota bacterium]